MTSITQKCNVDGCDGLRKVRKDGNGYFLRGYCNKHYQRLVKHGTTNGEDRQFHNMSRSTEYMAWQGIKDRCYNKKNIRYENYGGRGIKVCDEWLHDFKAFYDHMGYKPSPKHSIDRIDVNGNYELGNVRWATVEEQNNNKRNNRLFEIGGITKTMTQWAKEYGVSKKTVHSRLCLSWSIIEALNIPKRGRRTKQC